MSIKIDASRWTRLILAMVFAISLFAGSPKQSTGQSNAPDKTSDAGGSETALGDVSNAGGAAFADFDSLIDLIQTTVNPETWETLGGQSTIEPYPQGVMVSPEGTLANVASVRNSDAKSMIAKSNLAPIGNPTDPDAQKKDWRLPAKIRVVSLTRLRNAIVATYARGGRPDEAMWNLAGLSDIRVVTASDGELWVAGTVGGIATDGEGWFRDRRTGRTPLRWDWLASTMQSAISNTPFGCTIDPTAQGMRSAANVASAVNQGNVAASEADTLLSEAFGFQDIRVFGTQPDGVVALMLVEADRHMKELALGVHSMPDETANYFDVVGQSIASGPPSDLLLRLWFTASPRKWKQSEDGSLIQMSGIPVRLSGENQLALANGGRGQVVVDERTKHFVDNFNENWIGIRSKYPIYASVESVFQAASLAEASQRVSGDDTDLNRLCQSIAASSSVFITGGPVPKQTPTLAVHRQFRQGKKRHDVVVASGGVMVSPEGTLNTSPDGKANIKTEYLSGNATDPTGFDGWWWDVR